METNDLTRVELDQLDPQMEHGMLIKAMDHPYLLSPPSVPVAGATSTRADTVKVMAFHGIVYSHRGLYDPAVMPEYVAKVREVHKSILRCATLDPELPTWSEVRKGLQSSKWDLEGPMQAYAKPTGKERSMVYNEQSQQWEKAPVPEKAPIPEQGESEEAKKSSCS